MGKITKIEAKMVERMQADGSEVIAHAGEIRHWSLKRPGGMAGGDSTSGSIRQLYQWWQAQ